MPETSEVRCAGGVSYTLTYKKVKNINLRVREDGSVAVSAPRRCGAARADAFVREKTAWIAAAQQRALRVQKDRAPCTVGRDDALALFAEISDAVFPLFREILNGQKPVLKVRDMKTRWGVCNISARQITFSLRLAQMPRAAVEYVVLHEYAHFVCADHSARFWAVVARYLPDYKARRALLRGAPMTERDTEPARPAQ